MLERGDALWVAENGWRADIALAHPISRAPGGEPILALSTPVVRPSQLHTCALLIVVHRDAEDGDHRYVRAVGEAVVVDGVRWYQLATVE